LPTRLRGLPARCARGVHERFPRRRGRGECRVPAAPAASRAKLEVSTRASSPQVHRIHPAFPHAMVLTPYFVLSPATNSSCHRHQRIKACLSPVGLTHLRGFSISNGCQDHTASPSASAPFVSSPWIAHRLLRTRPAIPSRAQRCRVHRIPPRVRDDRDTPLGGTRRRGF
jgi:hypothetical protein